MKEAEFYELCKRHDLTYAFADDGRVWRSGKKSLEVILEAAKKLPEDVAVRIWNQVVDEKIVEDSRSLFYWTPKGEPK